MGEEKAEIFSAIQNGFFNEGIYRIEEESKGVSIEKIVPPSESKKVQEKQILAVEVISVTEEPENKLKLPEHPKELTPLNIEDPVKPIELENTIEFFGGNKKEVAILVNYPDERWIYFKDKIILERILASIKLTFDDVALINTHYFKAKSIENLSEIFKISKLIGFKINEPFLKDLKREEPVKTSKVAVFLMNSDLDEVAMNVDKKRILWNNIKIMFNIG